MTRFDRYPNAYASFYPLGRPVRSAHYSTVLRRSKPALIYSPVPDSADKQPPPRGTKKASNGGGYYAGAAESRDIPQGTRTCVNEILSKGA
ncbi:uncharacterized protein N7473_000919 [Penicillium subrubescens]|uniref:uncharacterized protein n=1 Tax=Penicillium subrubescens TaxID=1316194 RepID=UPI002544E88F|nr:uncharacterized protein N7473_000919 [Penicillium subrubescens]KAJ5911616.1 hypothetical protein N7473_000919 [Penicillium subrubescens]